MGCELPHCSCSIWQGRNQWWKCCHDYCRCLRSGSCLAWYLYELFFRRAPSQFSRWVALQSSRLSSGRICACMSGTNPQVMGQEGPWPSHGNFGWVLSCPCRCSRGQAHMLNEAKAKANHTLGVISILFFITEKWIRLYKSFYLLFPLSLWMSLLSQKSMTCFWYLVAFS